MIWFRGKPIIEHNIDLCKENGVRDIYVNTHHLHEAIESYLGNGDFLGVRISYSFEEDLLGTAGAVRKICHDFWMKGTTLPPEYFIVLYGDNYSSFNLHLLLEKAHEQKALGVIGFHYREDTSHSGVAEFDDDGRIRRFLEKPRPGECTSHWVNAGVYVLHTDIYRYLPTGVSDFGREVFPDILAKGIPLFGVCQRVDVFAFDNPEMYRTSMRHA
jgi:mannose-1-phosphate guanylyltransferase